MLDEEMQLTVLVWDEEVQVLVAVVGWHIFGRFSGEHMS